eukprot:TRINITY_DN4630_c0_g1_i1.p1 TRINITY_DN4630_c0_g1~~TRINITY_DN4630_c0_g1_i1.p1  ORF type:complete len:248 (+),score=86.33 TRINITY_DN4630_c0_g1_i1:57-746(+)
MSDHMTVRVEHLGEEVEVGKRLYVGNLPYKVRWQGLKDFFVERCGEEVMYADVKADWQGRSAGCGIVEFKTPEEAADVMIRMHDQELEGRRIFVRQDKEDRDLGGKGRGGFTSFKGKKGHGGKKGGNTGRGQGQFTSNNHYSCKVFVQNIAWETSWQTLKDHFRTAGEVVRSDINIDHRTGRSNGTGIVEFATPGQAMQAITTLNDVPLDGRELYVREDRMDSAAGKGY